MKKKLILVSLVILFLSGCSTTSKNPEIFSMNKKEELIGTQIFKNLDKRNLGDVVVAYGISTENKSINFGIRTSQDNFDSTKQDIEKIINKTLISNGYKNFSVNVKKK